MRPRSSSGLTMKLRGMSKGRSGRIRVRIRPDLPFDIPLSFIVSPEEERGRIDRTR